MGRLIRFVLTLLTASSVHRTCQTEGKTSKICYQPYGCFSDAPPFDRDFSTLPLPPFLINTHFTLYTQEPENYHPLRPRDNATFHQSKFDPSLMTTLIIHGFNEHSRVPWILRMTEALSRLQTTNIVLVDWHGSSISKLYPLALGNARLVGAQVEELIAWICACSNTTTAEDFHLIGFSLGAHVAGYAGRRLRKRGMLLKRITGLDPAHPGFAGKHPAVRLDRSDAALVDVIHSDSRPLVGLGLYEPIGHYDFYPNGGYTQPGCVGYMGIFNSFVNGGLVNSMYCNHIRAVELFLATINSSCPLRAYHSSSWSSFLSGNVTSGPGGCQEMGYHLRTNPNFGSFYLHTTGRSPFCKRHFIVSVSLDSRLFNPSVLFSVQILGKNGKSEITRKSNGFRRTLRILVVSEGDIGTPQNLKISFEGNDSLRLRSVIIQPMWSSDAGYSCCNSQLLTGNEMMISRPLTRMTSGLP